MRIVRLWLGVGDKEVTYAVGGKQARGQGVAQDSEWGHDDDDDVLDIIYISLP